MNGNQMVTSMQGAGLVTADAMAIAFNSHTMAKVLILGGLCGIITSWNSFLIGGSRVMFAMAKSRMILVALQNCILFIRPQLLHCYY